MRHALVLPVTLALVAIACASRAPEPAAPAPVSLAPAASTASSLPPEAGTSTSPATRESSRPHHGISQAAADMLARRRVGGSPGPAAVRADVGPCKTSADCPKSARCERAVCLCEGTSQACGGTCVSLFDSQNCGACGNVCSDICLRRAIGPASCGRCDAPLAACNTSNGACTNLDDDPRNCGACGKVCGKSTVCHRGACVAQRALGASCTDDAQCAALPGSCVDGKCDCTGSYSPVGGRCKGNSVF